MSEALKIKEFKVNVSLTKIMVLERQERMTDFAVTIKRETESRTSKKFKDQNFKLQRIGKYDSDI